MRSALFTILLVAGGPAAVARAQTPADSVPDRWQAALDFGFNGSTGNTELIVLTTGFRIKHLETDRFELEWSLGFRYGESEDAVVARSLESGLSYDLWPQSTWSPFVFANVERDTFRRLAFRSNAGAGVKRTFIDEKEASFSISTAALHDYEDFTTPVGDQALGSRTNARWSVRLRGHRLFDNGFRIDHITFYKPVWDEAGDYNVDTNTKATFLLSDRVGLNVSYTFRRDSTPPPDVEHNDQIVQAGVTIQM